MAIETLKEELKDLIKVTKSSIETNKKYQVLYSKRTKEYKRIELNILTFQSALLAYNQILTMIEKLED